MPVQHAINNTGTGLNYGQALNPNRNGKDTRVVAMLR